MVVHRAFSTATTSDFQFADAGARWPRGSNERTNAPLRHYFPLGTALTRAHRQQVLDRYAVTRRRPRDRSLGHPCRVTECFTGSLAIMDVATMDAKRVKENFCVVSWIRFRDGTSVICRQFSDGNRRQTHSEWTFRIAAPHPTYSFTRMTERRPLLGVHPLGPRLGTRLADGSIGDFTAKPSWNLLGQNTKPNS